MHITLTKDYSVRADTTLLGYQGETNSRKITFSGLVVDGCDLYKLQILYSDGKVYELPIKDEVVTITGSILREIGYVSCQLLGYSVNGSDYTIVFKSNIFELEIKEAIDGEVAPIPPYEEAADALEKVLAGVEAAKGYAESAGTAADRAETARAEAVKSQNDAKVSAAQASSAAQQTAADKIITAGYAKTAKTNADSTAADRQAVQTLAEQVAADKANVAENATKVAEDRVAAETAAQKAQSVADSLPEDYVTAVAKIAENTADIASIKLTDKEMKRRVDALYDIGQGITHKFETDNETAYAKTVPTGGKLMSVKNIGGRSIVFNQFAKNKPFDSRNGITTSTDGNYSVLDGTATNAITAKGWWGLILDEFSPTNGHKYLFCSKIISGTVNPANGCTIGTAIQKQIVGKSFIFEMSDKHLDGKWLSAIYSDKDTVFNKLKFSVMLIDLTAMFGSGNEPASVKEFEAMFTADYYPYNAGEIVSAGTESVVEQGKNLFDIEKCVKLGGYYGFEIDTNKTLKIALKDGKTCPKDVSFGIVYIYHGNTMANWLITSKGVVGAITNSSTMVDATQVMVACYPGNKETMQSIADAFDIMLVDGIYKSDTMPAYAPYHRTTYPIPEAIRNLPGYGWSAGTAKNYVDYENKRYVQCVNSADLGTLNWNAGSVGYKKVFIAFSSKIHGQKLSYNPAIASNILCSKYLAKSQNEVWSDAAPAGIATNATLDEYVYVTDTAYTDAATFKQAMSGVILYYELAEPIVTDISSLIPDDFLRNIDVEALGSVTFKNSNDNYHIPVPSEEEYVVKLSEVGGTT